MEDQYIVVMSNINNYTKFKWMVFFVKGYFGKNKKLHFFCDFLDAVPE